MSIIQHICSPSQINFWYKMNIDGLGDFGICVSQNFAHKNKRYAFTNQLCAEKFWCKTSIDFGDERITAIGKSSMQVVGFFNIMVFTPIGIGIADALNIADIIATKFRTTMLDETIKFQVPRIENVGRVADNYQFNVLCPFKVDKEFSKVK